VEKNDKCWYKDVCNVECTDTCIRYYEMKFLMEHSNLPKSKQVIPPKLQPQTIDEEAFSQLATIKNNITSFVENGLNLYIYSKNAGNGKTTWSIKLLLKYFDNIWSGNAFRVRGLFVHVPTLLNKLKMFNSQDEEFEELKKNLVIADLVVFDDIGANTLSNYDYSQLLSIIDQRLFEGKSNIFTSNFSPATLSNSSFGGKLVDRIASDYCIQFKGESRRGNSLEVIDNG